MTWVSSWSLNHGDTANPSAETRRRYRGVKEVDECLCPFVRRRHFYRQQSYFCHLLQVCIINWIIKVNWRLNPCSILLEFFSSDMNFPCTAKERENRLRIKKKNLINTCIKLIHTCTCIYFWFDLFNYRLFYSSFEINCFRYYMENAKTLYVHP